MAKISTIFLNVKRNNDAHPTTIQHCKVYLFKVPHVLKTHFFFHDKLFLTYAILPGQLLDNLLSLTCNVFNRGSTIQRFHECKKWVVSSNKQVQYTSFGHSVLPSPLKHVRRICDYLISNKIYKCFFSDFGYR